VATLHIVLMLIYYCPVNLVIDVSFVFCLMAVFSLGFYFFIMLHFIVGIFVMMFAVF